MPAASHLHLGWYLQVCHLSGDGMRVLGWNLSGVSFFLRQQPTVYQSQRN